MTRRFGVRQVLPCFVELQRGVVVLSFPKQSFHGFEFRRQKEGTFSILHNEQEENIRREDTHFYREWRIFCRIRIKMRTAPSLFVTPFFSVVTYHHILLAHHLFYSYKSTWAMWSWGCLSSVCRTPNISYAHTDEDAILCPNYYLVSYEYFTVAV